MRDLLKTSHNRSLHSLDLQSCFVFPDRSPNIRRIHRFAADNRFTLTGGRLLFCTVAIHSLRIHVLKESTTDSTYLKDFATRNLRKQIPFLGCLNPAPPHPPPPYNTQASWDEADTFAAQGDISSRQDHETSAQEYHHWNPSLPHICLMNTIWRTMRSQ